MFAVASMLLDVAELELADVDELTSAEFMEIHDLWGGWGVPKAGGDGKYRKLCEGCGCGRGRRGGCSSRPRHHLPTI